MKPAVKKWMPAVAIPAVIAAMGVGVGISSSATPQLEPKTPGQVIELMATSDVRAFSGAFRVSTDLGIPALPDAGAPASFGPPRRAPSTGDAGDAATPETEAPGTGSPTPSGDAGIADLLELLTGSHEARVYVDGPDKARLQVLGELEEQDIVRNGTSLWTYDSSTNKAVHTTLPDPPADLQSRLGDPHGAEGTHEPPTPGQLADRLLSAAAPTTEVTVEDGASVAGRDVYQLVLTPKPDATLVEDVTIGVDAATGVPLAVSVDATGQDAPAITAEFTSFTPDAPDPGLFEFTPPADATVHEKTLRQGSNWPKHTFGQKLQRPLPSKDDASHQLPSGPQDDWFTGSGWDAVATIPADQVPADLAASPLLEQLATPVDGGRLLHTSLLNVLIADDGRVLIGAVTLQRLRAAADAG